jgi:FkbM family methyltransferase
MNGDTNNLKLSQTPFFLSIRLAIARLTFWLFRFRTLHRAESLLSKIPHPFYARRQLFGYTFSMDFSKSPFSVLLYLEGERSIPERSLVLDLLFPGMKVVDVGANIGYYLLMFERGVGPSGKVVCIEPSPENLPELKRNIETNHLSNVTLCEVALGSSDGIIGLDAGTNSGVVPWEDSIYKIPMKRLDSLLQEKVELIKIDVEGYEGEVLKGALETIKKHRPVIFLELHPHMVTKFGVHVSDILKELEHYYSDISLHEYTKPEELSRLRKLFLRYFRSSKMVKKIKDPDAFLRLYDGGDRIHTFWVVCKP